MPQVGVYTEIDADAAIDTHAALPTVHQDAPDLILTHKGDASAHHAKTSKASEITSEQFSLARMPRAASGFLEGKGAGVNPAYSALVEADIPAHMAKGKLAWIDEKLLKGADAGADPEEIDLPSATKEFFVPATFGTDPQKKGEYAGYYIDAAADIACITFYAPNDFSTIIDAVVMVIAEATATQRLNLNSNYAAVGELSDAHAESVSDVDTVMVVNTVYEIDISGILTALAAGDYVGVRVSGDGTNEPTLQVVGVRFRYS